MNVYQSEFLTISKYGEALIQTWTEKDLNIESYKQELSNFMDLFYRIKPKELIWDIKKCNLIIPEVLDHWMAERVLVPINKKGIKKLAFTISDNIAVHLSIVASLEKARSILQSAYFPDLGEARLYSGDKKDPNADPKPPKFECHLNTDLNSFDINLNINFNDLPRFLTSIKQIEADNQFIKYHQENYNTLTIREIQIFRLLAFGKTNKQIAEELFIEESSVKTHRKNIKQKLNISSHFDIYQYARCFQFI